VPGPSPHRTRLLDVLVVANLGLGASFRANAALYLRAARRLVRRAGILDLSSSLVELAAPPAARLAIILDKDASTAEALRTAGARVVNGPEAILACDDKRRTDALLAAAGLAIPDSILLPPLYPKQPLDEALLVGVVERLGLPLVVKEAKGSFGSKVHLAASLEDLVDIATSLADRRLLAQRFVASSAGRDRRIQVAAGRVIAAMERRSRGDFRANLSAGGIGLPYLPSEREASLAIAAARAVGADNAGVDLLIDRTGEGSFVCEVNANAHIWRLSAITGIDVAEAALRCLLEEGA